MKTMILVLLAALAVTDLSIASEPYTVGNDGYYYDAAGSKYTRKQKWLWVDGYYYTKNCCRYWQPGYWQSNGYDYAKVAVTYKDPNWRTELLRIAAARDQIEGQVRYAREEQANFLESVQALGLTGNFYFSNYGLTGGYDYSKVQTGNTVYSTYKNSSVADIYGATNADYLFQQASALAKDGLAFGDRGAERFAGLINVERERSKAVAEILAKGQTAERVLNAASAAPGGTFRSTQTVQRTERNVERNVGGDKRLLAMRACISCHGDEDPQGGYKISQHWNQSADDQMEAVRRMTLPESDPKFMPRTPNGGAGKRLSADLILEFMPVQERAKLIR